MTIPNPREHIGANHPPGAIELAKPIVAELGKFLKDFPVIASEDEARAAKLALDRTVSVLKAIEEERKTKVDPLNAQVREINSEYHRWHNTDSRKPSPWNKLVETLRNRLSDWAWKEEARRREEAEAARKAAEEAERIAREAEAREKEAAETAAAGVCDVDIASATEEADTAFSAFKKTVRIAQRAERDTKVRIGGGLGKISSLRDRETLHVTDAIAAVKDIIEAADGNVPPTLELAILTCARGLRKLSGSLPAGITATYERSI